MHHGKTHLVKDLAIVALSVVVGVILVKTQVLKTLLTPTQELKFIGSFVAGIFFVSIFTAIPATVVLAEIAQLNSLWEVALFGAAGALIGDWLIFRFMRDTLSKEFLPLIKKSYPERLISIFRLKFFRWLLPFAGAVIIASPLPDELGLAMMGFSKMKTSLFIPLSFSLNFLGIMTVGLIAKTI